MLSQQDLEGLWPEGPIFAYRATVERLLHYEEGTTCPVRMVDAQQCWDVRLAVAGLLRVEAEHLEVSRRVAGVQQSTWLMTNRSVNMFCRMFLEGVR